MVPDHEQPWYYKGFPGTEQVPHGQDQCTYTHCNDEMRIQAHRIWSEEDAQIMQHLQDYMH